MKWRVDYGVFRGTEQVTRRRFEVTGDTVRDCIYAAEDRLTDIRYEAQAAGMGVHIDDIKEDEVDEDIC